MDAVHGPKFELDAGVVARGGGRMVVQSDCSTGITASKHAVFFLEALASTLAYELM